jgi:hypothetical protein
MTIAKTIAIVVIPLITLSLGTVSTMQPARATSMNLYDFNHYWNICVGGKGGWGYNYLYYNAGPYGVTWVAVVQIGLNGGDNNQYASFAFYTSDAGQGNLWKGYFGAGTLNWIQQGTTFYGSMTASFVDGINLSLEINNPDSVSQCFNVYVTLWYY